MLKRKLLLIPAALVLGAIGLSSLAGCSGNDDKTISFDAKGGKAVTDMTVQWGATVKAADLPTTTRTGYTFASWCTDEAATNPFSEKVVEDNFKLYAKWSINSYTVSYYDSDATTKLRDDAVYTYGSVIDVTDFDKANYKFEGWYTTSDYDKDTKVSDGYKMPGHNVSLYAKWNANSYQISFNKNGEDVYGSMSSITLTYGDELKITKCGFERKGYTFDGWNTVSKPTEENPGVAYPDEYVFQGIDKSQSLVLYAQWKANEYDVEFYNNETLVTFENPVKATYGQSLEIDTDEYKASANGFNFKGWGTQTLYEEETFDLAKNYFTKNGDLYGSLSLKAAKDRFDRNEAIYFVKGLDEDFLVQGPVALHALYERKLNTITFDVDGGEALDNLEAYYGQSITLPTPTKTGYNFGGWLRDEAVFTMTTMPADSLELKAQWTVNKYGVHYETNGGTMKNDVFVNYGTALADYLPTDLTKTGYDFAGWYYDAEFTNEAKATDLMPAEAVALYAKWAEAEVELKIVINIQDAENLENYIKYDEFNYDTYKTNEEVDIDSLVEQILLNEDDLEYYELGSSLGKITLKATGDTVEVNLVLVKHTVEFLVNSEVVKSVEVPHSTKIGIVDGLADLLELEGYSPLYNGEASYSNKVINDDYEIVVTYTVNSYALTAHAQGGVFTNEADSLGVSIEYGESFDDVEVPNRFGYTFEGWYFDASYNEKAETMDTTHKHIYAKWVANKVTVSYNSNGGTGEMSDSEFTYNGAVQALKDNAFDRTGYTFAGWKDKDGNTFTSIPASFFTEENRSLELFAQWTTNKVTVIYNGNGATGGEMSNSEFTYDGNNHPLADNAFTRTGYHFVGWNTQADGQGSDVTSILAGDFDATKSINLYAQWVKNVVIVTFDKNSDKATGGLQPQHYDYDPNGCSISNIAQFYERFGYQLVGWFDADGNAFASIPADYFTDASRTLTLYARWQAMKVKYIVEGNELFTSDFNDDKDFDPSTEFDKYIVDLYGKIQGYNYVYVEAGKQAAFVENDIEIIVLYSYVKQIVAPYLSVPTQDAVIGILGGMGVDVDSASLLYTAVRNYIQIAALKDLSPVQMVVAIASQNGIPQETALTLYGAIYNYLPDTLREDPACYAYILLIASIQGYDLTNPQVLEAAVNNISTLYAGIKMNLDSIYQDDTLCYLYMLVTSQVMSIDITDASKLASNVATLSGLYGTVKDLYVNTDPSEIDNPASYIFVAAAANKGNVNLTPTTIPVAVPQYLGTFAKVNNYLKVFPFNEENATLYQRILALMVSQDQDTLTALTSYVGIQRDLLIPEYEAYKANGWNPVSNNSNNYFDGWVDTAGQEAVSRTAFFVYRLPKVGAYLESHDAEKVTFTWPSVDPKNVYGYQVEVYVNNVKDTLRTPEHPVVGTLSFPVYFSISEYKDDPAYIEIHDGDKIEIHIIPLFKGLDGNKQETSHAYVARTLAGQTCDAVAAHELSGEEAIFNYTHFAESDIDYNPDNTVIGDNYYQYKLGDDRRLVLFTSCDYHFNSADKVELIADDADSIGKATGTDLVIYTIPADNVIVKVTKGEEVIEYKTVINPLLDSINLGTSYRAHQSNRVTNTLTLDTTYSYIASDTSLKPFKVGKALHLNASEASEAGLYDYTDYKHTDGSDYYYNGVKLDFIATAQSGGTISNNNFEYDVTVKKGTTTLNGNGSENPDYYYDVANNVLYFLTSNCEGLCTITVTPRVPGAGESLNITAPQFILADANLANNYGASFTFQVGEGYNVFSHESLSTLFSDTHAKEINILKNIKAVLAPNMVPYVDYCLALPGSSAYNMILGDEGSKHGEVDIKDDTAHMEKVYSGFKGPKYELVENAGDNYSFIAWYRDGSNETEGRFIYTTKTSGDNIYYIDRGAEWVQNKDTGHFKIMNATPYDGGNAATYAAGLKLANIYSREGAAFEALTINGNYFSIDASDLPCIYSVNGVSIGSNTRYHVQSVVVSIFMNAAYDPNQLDTSVAFDVANSTANVTVNELTLRGNTANTSRIYSEGEDAYIQTEMEEKSGGINGFATRPYSRSGFNEDVAPSDSSQAVAAYANRKATSNFILNSVNVYDTLIGLYSDTNIDINYTRVDNSWANGFYSHSSNGSTVMKLRNSVIGSSGGAALDIEDTMLGYNPYVDIDYRNVILDNYIAGSEPWLRAYGMEVMALNIKGQLEAAANAQGFTIIQKSTSGAVESELFNFAYFGKVEGASFDQYITDILDKINVEGITSSTPMPGMDGVYMYTNTITEYAPGQYGPEYIFGTADGRNGIIYGPSKIPYSTGEHQYLVFFMPQTTIGEYGTVFYGFVEITPLA